MTAGAVPPAIPSPFLRELDGAVDDRTVVVDPDVLASHGVDWTGRFRGLPSALLRPVDSEALEAIVAAARRHGIALVARGGNTGLVGGATPVDGEAVVDLGRMRGITDIDPVDGQLDARAGTPMIEIHAAAASAGWSYGVDWGARDTATIGGSVATNAGGIHVIRHGDTRAQLLGIAAVLGSGDRIDHRPRVVKDNTGLDLTSLLCGSEGTLGFVTDVRVRLVPPPGPSATALVAFSSTSAALSAAAAWRRSLRGLLAIEFLLRAGLELLEQSLGLPDPLDGRGAAHLLVEIDDPEDPLPRLAAAVEGVDGVVASAVATDEPGRARLWRSRELHTVALATLGIVHKFDVTLPTAELIAFVDDAPAIVAEVDPDARVFLFGHAGDGNVHVNVANLSADPDRLADAVYGTVAARGGSISAEHGIGRAKRNWIGLARSAGDLRAMRAVRTGLDPDGICNPAVAP